MLRKIFFLLFICLFQVTVSQDQAYIDSVTKVINSEIGEQKINTICRIGRQLKLNNPSKSLEFGKQALELSENMHYTNGIASANYIIATYYFNVGDFEKSLEIFQKSLSTYQELGDKKNEALILLSIGDSYFRKDNYNKALAFYIKAEDIYEKLKDDNGNAMALESLAQVYRVNRNYSKAIEYFKEALLIWEKNSNFPRISTNLNNLGIIYQSINDNLEAIKCFQKCLDIHINNGLNNKASLFKVYNNIAISYANINMVDEAIKFYNKALIISKEVNNKYAISAILANIADIHLTKGDYKTALACADSAIKIAKEISVITLEYTCCKIYADIYSKIGDYEKALKYQDQYYTLKDSVFSEESCKRIEETKIEYENEKKEKSIIIKNFEIKKRKTQNLILFLIASLVIIIAVIVFFQYRIKTRRNLNLIMANHKLEESERNLKLNNETKDKLLSIISHDLKNPFDTLISLTEFLDENFIKISKKHKLIAIKTISNSANQTYELLNNLSQWSNSQSVSLQILADNYNISKTILKNINLLRISAQKKSISILSEIEDDTIVYADENYIDIVLRNLLTNAIKFTDINGEIKISAKSIKKTVEITVSDNGAGLTESDSNKLFRLDVDAATIGVSELTNSKYIVEKGTGLGLIICKELVERNNGKIWIESKLGIGSKLIFTLPKGTKYD